MIGLIVIAVVMESETVNEATKGFPDELLVWLPSRLPGLSKKGFSSYM